MVRIEKTTDGSDTLFSEEYNQTYHSTYGALQETRYVFLRCSGVLQRLEAGLTTRVLEVGFGSGLNFFVTAAEAIKYKATLEFISLEKNLLQTEIFKRLNHDQFAGLKEIRQEFIVWHANIPYPVTEGAYAWQYTSDSSLALLIGDATLKPFTFQPVDAVYMDAFSPDVNPELWTERFFTKLYNIMDPGAVLATYSAKGSVRRAIQVTGLIPQRLPGPPGKREIIVARKEI